MSLETASYIHQLDAANPLGSDPIAAGDDHIRLIKAAVKATFPNITGPVNLTQAQINALPTDLATAVTNVEADIEALSDTVDAQIAALGSMSAQNANAVNITGGTIAAAVLQALYPVGTIYTNATNNTNPGSLFGFGTWVAFGAGRVPVGFDSGNTNFNAAEKTGGVESVALTEAQMPKHFHQYRTSNSMSAPQNNEGAGYQFGNYGGGTPDDPAQQMGTYSTGGDSASGSTGTGTANGAAHTNLQPYITVYMWKRTA